MSTSTKTKFRYLLAGLAAFAMIAGCSEADDGGDESADTEEPATDTDSADEDTEPSEDDEAEDAPGDEEPLEITDFTLQFPNSGPSASLFPFYIADARGYYEENGLNVEFLYGPGSASAIQQLIAGNADIAMTTPGAVLDAAAEGFEVKWVYQHFYFNRFQVGVEENSPVESIEDLDGSAIGISDASGGEVPTVRGSIAAAGLTEGEDIEITPVGEGAAAIQALEEGVVDALGVSKPDILTLQMGGLNLRTITPEVVNDFPGDGIAVTPEMLEENPELVARFIRATIQGWAWAQANPDDAYDIIKADYASEQLTDDDFGQGFHEINLADTATPDQLSPEEHGTLLPESWEANAEFFFDIGILSEEIDVSNILTDEAVEAAWDLGIDLDAIAAEPAM